MQRVLFVFLLILLSAASFSQALAQDKRFSFKEQIVDPNVGVGYATTVADLNQDRKPDIVVRNG